MHIFKLISEGLRANASLTLYLWQNKTAALYENLVINFKQFH